MYKIVALIGLCKTLLKIRQFWSFSASPFSFVPLAGIDCKIVVHQRILMRYFCTHKIKSNSHQEKPLCGLYGCPNWSVRLSGSVVCKHHWVGQWGDETFTDCSVDNCIYRGITSKDLCQGKMLRFNNIILAIRRGAKIWGAQTKDNQFMRVGSD